MRSRLGTLLALSLAVLMLASAIYSRDTRDDNIRFQQALSEGEFLSDLAYVDPGLLDLYQSAAVDTYCIVWYDFESMGWQGWTQIDDTEQRGTFFHADDFAGLGGGYGPLEGEKSIWCGVRPDTLNSYLCGWQSAPGYGNDWHQILVSDAHTNATRVSYLGRFDTEAGYDYVYVEYQDGSEWKKLATYDGVVEVEAEHTIACPRLQTKVRFRFVSDGEWSDQDGLHDTDGAAIIDSIMISDSEGPISIETFELWPVGATSYGYSRWNAEVREPYGAFSKLWSNLESRFDPCNINFGTQIVFFVELAVPVYVTPGCRNTDLPQDQWLCQKERVVSPIIDLTKFSTGRNEIQDADIPPGDLSDLGGTIFRYTIYQDLPLSNLVFPGWDMRNISETGCPGPWVSNYMISYYWPSGYVQEAFEIGSLIDSDRIQVSLTCYDMCSEWYATYGDCFYHTAAPWYDNVRLYRYAAKGPQWSYRWLDLFQDNFPEVEYDLESWVRADAANDLNSFENPVIRPGDSIVVTCAAPAAGELRTGGATGEAEVYLHVRVQDIRPWLKPQLYGPDLAGTYGTYVTDDGEWTVIQCDSALAGGSNIVPDKFMVDLNDSLLTRGYVVEYYFEAFDAANDRSVLPKHADRGQFFEFTCLPTGRSDVLFVDDFHGRGYFAGVTEVYWNATFSTQLAKGVIPPENQPDRYDVNSPSSMVGNGLASRARLNQLTRNDVLQSGYTIIIWDSGNLVVGTISDGSTMSDKADDCSMLINWLDQSENGVGLLVCGDNIAHDLNGLPSTQSLELMSTYCGVDFIHDSYFDMTGGFYAGGIVSPLLTTDVASIFEPDLTFYAFGGCPTINDFDVLDATAYGAVALWYPDFGGESYAAGIQSEQTNAAGYDARTVWLGFSWMYIRDDELSSPMDRYVLFRDIYVWFNGMPLPDITEDEAPGAYRLSQNFPNPFNPSTMIEFDVRAKGHVELRIYNVAGQLVKTLVDDMMDAGSYKREWRGTNNLGADVASGVYFYRLEAGEYENVKKMVLLR